MKRDTPPFPPAEPMTPRGPAAWGATPYPYPPQVRRRGSPWYIWLLGGCLGFTVLLIIACAIILGMLSGLFLHFSGSNEASSSTVQTLAVTGEPTISVHNAAGDVTVIAGSDGEVRVEADKYAQADSVGSAQQALSALSVSVSQNGDAISIETTTPPMRGAGSRWIDLTVTVPAETNLSLQLDSGDGEAQNVTGAIVANLTAGDLTLDGVTLADASTLTLQSGDLTLHGALAPNASLNAHLTSGDAMLTVPASTSAHLDAATSVGSIDVTGWPLRPQEQGSGASLVGDLGIPSGSSVTVRVQTGDITLGQG